MYQTTKLIVALVHNIEFTQQRIDEITQHDDLTIHEMADLDRYANTLNHFIQAYHALTTKG